MNTFPPGTPIPLNNPMEWTVTFLDVNGVPFDPNSGIKITLTDPDGDRTEYHYPGSLSKSGVGVYSVTVTASDLGVWAGVGTGLLPDGTPVTTTKILQRVY